MSRSNHQKHLSQPSSFAIVENGATKFFWQKSRSSHHKSFRLAIYFDMKKRMKRFRKKFLRLVDTMLKYARRDLHHRAVPTNFSFPLTAQCNYRCSFCEINGVDRQLQRIGKKLQVNSFTLDEFSLFEPIIKNAQIIDFGGMSGQGEPLLSPHFQEICVYLRSINPRCTIAITTNASCLNETLTNFLIASAPISLTYSVHAMTPETYRKIMGNDFFERVTKNIAYFSLKSINHPRIQTTLNFGIGKHNYFEAEQAIEFAKTHHINCVQMYLYYKSPNAFEEDYSIYSDVSLANATLEKVYQRAKHLQQPMGSDTPPFIQEAQHLHQYSLACRFPFCNFILKADPYFPKKAILCVCNRIMLFHVDFTKPITPQDLQWVWQHPIMHALRDHREQMQICHFCKHPDTPKLRSLEQPTYKRMRDEAVKTDLQKFQSRKFSPNQSFELFSENIYSLPG